MRRLPFLLLIVLFTAAALAADAVPKRLVHVRVPTDEVLSALVGAGFDVAGMNKRDRTAGVVATDDDLRRLEALGFGFTLGPRSDDPIQIQALQDYTDPAELQAFINQVAAAYPNLVRTRVLSSNLFEGHEQVAVKITKDPDLPHDRPIFVLDAQHHAREVMTPEIAKDMIDRLTSLYGTDPDVTRWVDNIEIWVVPSVNPDGAAVVFTGDNMWRRNRRPSCAVDVNRNYPHAWGSCNGSSGSCTDDTNRGSEPASEPETQGMLGLAADTRPFYALSYHTYGEYIMYSYGCTNPDEMTAMQEVAQALNGVLQDDNGQTGTYTVGPIWSAIYLVDGGSVDTWYAQYGTYAFTIEASCCSFQPDYATWRNVTVQRQRTAWQFFLNRTLDAPQIRGKITNAATGLPVPARVEVQEVTFTHGETPRRADSRGIYHWLARAGQTYHLTYSQPGYCTVQRTVGVGTGPATENVTMAQPAPPASVTATANGDHRIDLSWSAAPNATQYRISRSLDSGGPYSEVALVDAPATAWSDLGVSGGVPYYYVVRALQPCESGPSIEVSAQTTGACTVGPAFAGVASVSNPGSSTCSLQLDWSAATTRCGGAVSYEVHRSATSPFVPSAASRIATGLASLAYTDQDALADGGTYHYVVRAVDAGNGANDGNVLSRAGTPTGPSTVGTWRDDGGDAETAKLTGSAPWSVLASGGKTSPKVYATGTYSNNLCAALTSPSISVQGTSVLSFASKYDIEAGWDAAVVEVAEGPAFATWSRLTTLNYPDSLSNTGNACAFPRTFAGTVFSRNYTTPAYPATDWNGSLAAFAGKEIRLRWRIGSDSTGTGKGMWVDDVAVTDAIFRASCTSAGAGSPGEVASITASRGAGTAVDVVFTPTCGVSDHVAYWGTGPISGAAQWSGTACGLGTGGVAAFDPGDPQVGQFIYFVVVGQDVSREGSYGSGSTGERPEASGFGACDRPQVLGGDCP